MTLLVGCPIANRAWALPEWFRCLDAQSRRPDGLVFVHSGYAGDDPSSYREDPTWLACEAGAEMLGVPIHLHHDPGFWHPRHDNQRFHTLARLRNVMLDLADGLDADQFLSLDSDIMLRNPDTIQTLLGLIDEGWATASPVTWLHPAGKGSWAVNAGLWNHASGPVPSWVRPDPEGLPWGANIRIDIPMAAMLMNRKVIEKVRYRWHEGGEDIGFAHALREQDCTNVWATSLEAEHIWSERHMAAA